MNYELAKELKDAGFPQGNAQWVYPDGVMSGIPATRGEEEETYYVPTLSELIEAMPMRKKYLKGLVNDAFFELHKLCGEKPYYRAILVGVFETPEQQKEYEFVCDNPEEAVARLWLALNPRQK